MKQMDEDEEKAVADQDFNEKVEGWKEEEDRKTAKRRQKRKREKEARQRKKNLKLSGIAVGNGGADGAGDSGGDGEVDDDDEFDYKPMQQQEQAEQPVQDTDGKADEKPAAAREKGDDQSKEEAEDAPAAPFANDGSFLEMMKKQLAEEAAKASGGGDEDKEADAEANEKAK